MITFFRHIRQNLLSQGKTGKYLKYAIGEILLVVIGILIALQINNWNESRKERDREYRILVGLQQDFKNNRSRLEGTIVRIPQLLDTLAKGLDLVDREELEYDQKMQNTILETGYILTDLVEGALNSILSSEKLELITNEQLKNRLTAYPSLIKKFQKQEAVLENYVLEIQRPILRRYVSLANSTFVSDDPAFKTLKGKMEKSDFPGLLKNREYQNAMVGIYLQNKILMDFAQLLLAETTAIYELLASEIEKNPNNKLR